MGLQVHYKTVNFPANLKLVSNSQEVVPGTYDQICATTETECSRDSAEDNLTDASVSIFINEDPQSLDPLASTCVLMPEITSTPRKRPSKRLSNTDASQEETFVQLRSKKIKFRK